MLECAKNIVNTDVPGKGLGPGFSLSGGALPQGVWGNRPLFGGGPAVFFYRKNAYKMLRNLSIVVKIRGLRSRRAKIYEYFALF